MELQQQDRQIPHLKDLNLQSFQANLDEIYPKRLQTKKNFIQNKNNLVYKSNTSYFGTNNQKIQLKLYNSIKKEYYSPNIIQVQSRSNVIALRDNEQNVWLISNIFPKYLNLCQIIKRKIVKMFLDQNMIFLKSKKNFFIIGWNKLNLPLYDLKSIQVDKQYEHLIQCFQIFNFINNSWFYFSYTKKIQYPERFFQICQNEIVTNPIKRSISLSHTIKGISASKTHILCWTTLGQLFSWGERSLALGHTQFQENVLKNPKKIAFFDKNIVKAVASTHHSLALTVQGKLFQWGIKYHKKIQSFEVEQQFIFKPRQLIINNPNNSPSKIVCVKGKYDNFGILTLNQQFYVWGKKIPIKLIQSCNIATQKKDQQSCSFIQNLQKPTICNISLKQKIIDYQIQENHIILVTIDKNSPLINQGQLNYWKHKKQKLSSIYNKKRLTLIKMAQKNQPDSQNSQKQLKLNQFKYKKKLNSQCTYHQKQNDLIKNSVKQSLKSLNNGVVDDKLSLFIKQNQSKQIFFKNIHKERQVFSYLMSPTQSEIESKKQKITIPLKYQRPDPKLRFSGSIATTRQNIPQKQRRKLKSACKEPSKMVSVNHERMKFLIENSPLQLQKKKNYKLFKQSIKNKDNKIYKTAFVSKADSPKKSYQQKLQKVIQKKKTLQSSFYHSTLKKMQANSLQYRQKINEEMLMEQQRKTNREILQKTIFQKLIKEYIVRTLTNQIDRGRQIKIQIFVRNLKYNRVQKNIKRLFIRNRINFDYKKLKTNHPKKLLKLLIVYRNFVIKWKEHKFQKLKNHCFEQIIKYQLKKKMMIGILKVKTVSKKIQKINQWICLVNKQKLKCLNLIWKKNVLSMFKLNEQYETLVNSMSLNTQNLLTFKEMFAEKVKQNPALKIQNYIECAPLFKIKMMQINNIFSLFPKENNPLENLPQKIVQLNKNKKVKNKTKTKIKDEIQQKFDLRALVLNPKHFLLPYSEHYKIFSKLKNYEINILDSTKLQEKWINQDKRALKKILSTFLQNNMRQFGKKMRKYRIDLANFIKANYKQISEKRWKYIIEYNKVKTTKEQQERKLKEVRRILRLVGYENILQTDCLPQKHRIIDEAIKLKNSPKLPTKEIVFQGNQFKKLFKEYYQTLCSKAKALRRLSSPKQINRK